MKKEVYRFSSIVNIILFMLFTCIIIGLAFVTLFLADEKNVLSSTIAISLSIICILCLYYSLRNKIIITENELIYIGFKKYRINKKDILSIESDGFRIIIKTNKKTYITAGYTINKRWNTEKELNKNKNLVRIIKESL